MTWRASYDAGISSKVAGQKTREDGLCGRIDEDKERDNGSPLESKIFRLHEKWKKHPESANSPTFHGISKKLNHSTLELIRMYHEDKDALRRECDGYDPECIIAFRQFHRRREEERQAA